MVGTKHLGWLLGAVSLLSSPAAAALATRDEFSTEEIVEGDALASLASLAYNESIPVASAKMTRRTFGGSCNLGNVKVRQEWRTMSSAQRKNYISAVKCLRTKPSLLAPGVAPGSKSLFDDFVAIHFNQTIFIHLTVRSPFPLFLFPDRPTCSDPTPLLQPPRSFSPPAPNISTTTPTLGDPFLHKSNLNLKLTSR
jgi:hypothetical protein